MQFWVTFGCDFLTTSSGNVGIWYIDEGDGECVDWPNDAEDIEIVKGAQSALTLSTIAAFCAGLMVLLEWLFCEVCCAGCLEGIAFFGSWFFGGATFMLYGLGICSDDIENCGWGTNATSMTIACGTMMIVGIVLCWYVHMFCCLLLSWFHQFLPFV